jgi:peptide-methionine (R)-S-oxide reductase
MAPPRRVVKTEAEWRRILTPEQFRVARQEGTERAWTSPLNNEKRKGVYACVGCGTHIWDSDDKFDSGTGWPSFTRPISANVVGTKTDWKLLYPRTEVHCAVCGAHHGHVFDDGPPPTGQRWCINGVVLTFKPGLER